MSGSQGKHVVYWIGAGASAQALPVVNEMPAAFRSQQVWVRNLMKDRLEAYFFKDYVEKLYAYALLCERFGTIDTYARSLFILKKREELSELKLHLALFFLLEQAVERRSYQRVQVPAPDIYEKKEQIDTRYMTWLAQLLDSEGLIKPCVQVLSWNYDLQLEHAVGVYRGLEDLSEVHDTAAFWFYPDPEQLDMGGFTRPAVIHLNGIAGQAMGSRGARALYRGLVAADPEAYILDLFKHYAEVRKGNARALRAMDRTFCFAWEENSITEKGVSFACDAMERADVLVIIGYSFPAFNRTIDMRLMHAFIPRNTVNKDKRIHFQSRSHTEASFGHIFGISQESTNIKVDSYVDQFYLPPELFN